MFERVIPTGDHFSGAEIDGELLIGRAMHSQTHGGNALRALEWNEITARLNAARDLRTVMRRDSRFNIQGSASSFGDAAASYFEAISGCEPDVNHDVLEQGKAYQCIGDGPVGNAATGDARDD